MTIQNIRRFGLVSTPNLLALKSPSDYLSLMNKLNPAWGTKFHTAVGISQLEAGCLWTAAVAIGNACRISEVLRITNRQILPNGTAYILGAKGSNSRLIYTGLSPETASEYTSAKGVFKVFPWDYQHVYRTCLKFGLSQILPGHEHRTVTHAGRYNLAQKVSRETSPEVAGEILGHKSKTAVEYYTNPGSCKKRFTKKKPQTPCQTLEDLLSLLQ